jgi:hypothetical protein
MARHLLQLAFCALLVCAAIAIPAGVFAAVMLPTAPSEGVLVQNDW